MWFASLVQLGLRWVPRLGLSGNDLAFALCPWHLMSPQVSRGFEGLSRLG